SAPRAVPIRWRWMWAWSWISPAPPPPPGLLGGQVDAARDQGKKHAGHRVARIVGRRDGDGVAGLLAVIHDHALI
ncbi:hypothetical protein, partial [Cupriavidus necator]